MLDAFWGCLAREPFHDLTIRGICAKAHVQRNTFYYHFDGIGDLAEVAVSELDVEGFVKGLFDVLFSKDGDLVGYVFAEDNLPYVEKVHLMLGPHGSQLLSHAYKERVLEACERHIDLSGIPPLFFDFALGGLASVLGRVLSLEPELRRDALKQMPIREMFQAILHKVQPARMPQSAQQR